MNQSVDVVKRILLVDHQESALQSMSKVIARGMLLRYSSASMAMTPSSLRLESVQYKG